MSWLCQLRSRPIRLRAFRHQDTPQESRPPAFVAQEGMSMTAITVIPPIVNDDPPEPCEFDDCMYVDGACRCRHGEIMSREFDIPALNDVVLPF